MPTRTRNPLTDSFAAILLFATVLLAACGEQMDSAEDKQARAQQYIQRAQSYADNGQFRAAVIEAKNAINQAPERAGGYVALAKIYNTLGQGKVAAETLEPFTDNDDRSVIIEYTRALLLRHKYRSAHDYLEQQGEHIQSTHGNEYQLLRGRIAAGQGDIDSAKHHFSQIDPSAPQYRKAQLELAKLQLRDGDTAAAINTLDTLLEEQPDYADALTLKAKIAYQKGDLEKAESLLSDALINIPDTDILTPQKILVLRNLISTLTELRRTNEALIYSKLLAEASPEAEALKNKLQQGFAAFKAGETEKAKTLLGEVYEKSEADSAGILLGIIAYNEGDYATADEYLSKHVDPEISSPQAVRMLAATQLKRNQGRELLEAFDLGSVEEQTDPGVLTFTGLAQLKAGNEKQGVAALKKAIELAPQINGARLTLSQYYLGQRQFDKAQALIDAGIEAYPDDLALHTQWIKIQLAAEQQQAALQHARQLATEAPESGEAQRLYGQTALAVGEPATAVDAMNKALALNAQDKAARYELGRALLLTGEAAQAQAAFRQLIESAPALPKAYKGLIAAMETAGADDDISPATIEKRLLKEADTPTARAVLAEFYLRHNQFEQARRLAASLPEQAADNRYIRDLQVTLALDVSRRALGKEQYDKARSALMEGLNSAPRDSRLLALLTKTELLDGRPAEAEKILQQLQAANPNYPLGKELEGDVREEQNAAEAALQAYRAAWQSYQSNELGMKIYNLLQKQGQNVAAKAHLAEWHQRQPENPVPLITAAQLAHQQGDKAEAARQYEQALALAPDNIIVLNNLAWIYKELGDERAIATAERAYQLTPDNSAVADTYGWILYHAGDQARAVEILEKALAGDPDNAEIQAHLEQARQ